MKCKVINPFIDKVSKKRIEKEFECTEARFKEIQSKGNFLEPIKEPKKAEEQKGI